MMRSIVKLLSVMILGTFAFTNVHANQERAGQAGADQLLVNPWAASSGLGNTNMANVSGFEAMNSNAAGIVDHGGTEIGYTRTTWLSGSGVYLNSLGFSQGLGLDDAHAIGISLVSLDLGEIQRRTRTQAEEGAGVYTPQFFNLGVGYSRLFSQAIRGGAIVRVVSESLPDISAMGVSLDAGIQYVAGEYDNLRFGIALRNVGPPMQYSGEGLAVRGSFRAADFDMTLQQRSQRFELPSQLAIGGSYAWHIDRAEIENEEGEIEERTRQKITFNGVFVSNSFTHDQFGAGVEYDFRNTFKVRGGYVYEEGLFNDDNRVNAFMGPTAGAAVRFPLGDQLGAHFEVDYSFRYTDHFDHTHNFGGRITF